MRIPCPYCGVRDVREFAYLGDASVRRPDPQIADALGRFTEYVYLRDNPWGPHQELWYHAAGCHAWLAVTRNTATHQIQAVEPASNLMREPQQ
jgi:methylglutamate dehydrogenase subunit B